MRFDDVGSEINRCVDECERMLDGISKDLYYISNIDSALLGCRFNARIQELRSKLAMAETERRELADLLASWRMGS